MADPNYETNPYTNRLVKKCGKNEERIPVENGDWKTFKCYKRCNANQMRNMRTMRCRKQKQDYELYPSPSSFHKSNDLRKTNKKRSSFVDYNVYPSPSSFHKSNDLRKTSKKRSSSKIVDYNNVYPSPSSFHKSNDLRKTTKKTSSLVDYNNVYPPPPSIHKSNTMSKKTKKLEAIRTRKSVQKGREWFWEHGKKKR